MWLSSSSPNVLEHTLWTKIVIIFHAQLIKEPDCQESPQEPSKMGSCFSANKKHVRTNTQSYNGTQKIVGGNIMQNMTLEFDEVPKVTHTVNNVG